MLLSLNIAMGISACSNDENFNVTNKINKKMKGNTNIDKNKKVEVTLNKDEIFIAFVAERKTNTDELFQAYLADVFPTAMKHGAKPIANLLLDKVATKNTFKATDFIGLSAWPSKEAGAAFHEEMPHKELDKLRTPIWNELKTFAIPIERELSFNFQENKIYEFKIVWGVEHELEKYMDDISWNNGRVLFDLPVVNYDDLNEGETPNRIALIEWSNMEVAETFRVTNSEKLKKEEAFYSHFEMPEEEVKEKISQLNNHLNIVLDATPSQVWDILKTGGDVDKWFPYIKTCELRENGTKRFCTTEDGKTLEESIIKIDHKNKVFVYAIDHHTMEMPLTNVVGTMSIDDVNGKAELDWEVTFSLTQKVDENALIEMKKGMVDLMQIGINGIKTLTE